MALFMLTHLPVVPLVIVPAEDKTMHFLGYLILAILLFASLRLLGRRHPAVMVLTVLLVYAAIDELLQIPVGRHAEMGDWYADAAGAAVGAVAAAGAGRWIG